LKRPLLLLTRPAEEAERTATAARAAGFEALCCPLLEIVPVPFEPPEATPEALLFTSARAPAIVAARAPALRAVPAYAVGARTGEEAEKAGFRLAGTGDRDGTATLRLMARSGVYRVLHAAGEATAPLQVPPGVQLARLTVYSAARVPALPAPGLSALAEGRAFATLLFSARTARHFRDLATTAGLDLARLRIVALSPAVAQAAGTGWASVVVAAQPELAGALAAARLLWQGEAHG
jgi:uroporphyrinogen-III synthase